MTNMVLHLAQKATNPSAHTENATFHNDQRNTNCTVDKEAEAQ